MIIHLLLLVLIPIPSVVRGADSQDIDELTEELLEVKAQLSKLKLEYQEEKDHLHSSLSACENSVTTEIKATNSVKEQLRSSNLLKNKYQKDYDDIGKRINAIITKQASGSFVPTNGDRCVTEVKIIKNQLHQEMVSHSETKSKLSKTVPVDNKVLERLETKNRLLNDELAQLKKGGCKLSCKSQYQYNIIQLTAAHKKDLEKLDRTKLDKQVINKDGNEYKKLEEEKKKMEDNYNSELDWMKKSMDESHEDWCKMKRELRECQKELKIVKDEWIRMAPLVDTSLPQMAVPKSITDYVLKTSVHLYRPGDIINSNENRKVGKATKTDTPCVGERQNSDKQWNGYSPSLVKLMENEASFDFSIGKFEFNRLYRQFSFKDAEDQAYVFLDKAMLKLSNLSITQIVKSLIYVGHTRNLANRMRSHFYEMLSKFEEREKKREENRKRDSGGQLLVEDAKEKSKRFIEIGKKNEEVMMIALPFLMGSTGGITLEDSIIKAVGLEHLTNCVRGLDEKFVDVNRREHLGIYGLKEIEIIVREYLTKNSG